MEPLEIAESIKEKFPDSVREVSHFRGQVSVTVNREKVFEICLFLKEDISIDMNYLSDLCGVDYNRKEFRFEVVYNLYSLKYNHRIRIKALVPEADPSIDSVVSIWRGANFHERETYDMFGIIFTGHPNLRRILLPEEWEGFPLRKDYPLQGKKDWEYRGFKEAKELHAHDNDWTIK